MIIRVLMRFYLVIAPYTTSFSFCCPHADLVFYLKFTVVTFVSPPRTLYNLIVCFHKRHFLYMTGVCSL